MALNPSPHRQSVLTFPTPNVRDILFFETVDAERVGSDVPEYGSSHPDFKKWPNHRLVHIETADDQNRYYRYYYAADQTEQDDDNWSFSKADIGGTKFDAVTREYVIRRSEFDPDSPAMGATMPDVPSGKFSGTHVLAERKQIPINDKVLNGLYVIEQRTYVKKVPLYRLDFDDLFQTTNYTKQTLYYATESVGGSTIATLVENTDSSYWAMDSGKIRTAQQLSDNWYAVTEQEVVKCPEGDLELGLSDLQTVARKSIVDATSGKTTSDINLFSTYTSSSSLVRNTSCWAHNLKGITGFVAWNNKTGIEKKVGGVAITPRHILYAGHAAYSPNDIVYFCSKNNEIYARTIVEVRNHESYVDASTWDFGIARLDSDLPAAIEVVKVLPKDAYQYFQTDDFSDTVLTDPDVTAGDVLAMTTDQDENAHIRRISELDFGSFDYNNPDSGYHEYELERDTGDYSNWSETVVAGDSGSVATLVINGECVLLGVMSKALNSYTVQGAFLGAPNVYKEVNDLISDVDAAYDSNVPLNYTTTSKELAFSYKSYRTEEGVAEVYPSGLCATLEYETVISYNFPPILERIELDVWEERAGGAPTYPRILYSKGAYSGPCKARVFIGWATTPPPAVVANNKPIPEPISIRTPIFSLDVPPTLHGAVSFVVNVGNNDETYVPTNATYSKGATNVTSWEPHIVSSEVKPFRGGWLVETVLVYPPS